MTNVVDYSRSPSGFEDDLEIAANIYSLICALEALEQAYIAGHTELAEYEEECLNLLSLCKIIEDAKGHIFQEFSKEYSVKCPLALMRLDKGIPASLERRPGSVRPRNEKYLLFELSEHFITLVDALKLGCKLVEELFPLIHQLIGCLRCIQLQHTTSAEYPLMSPVLNKLEGWHLKMEKMAAHDKLEEADIRQLAMDTEAAYGSFKTFLRKQS